MRILIAVIALVTATTAQAQDAPRSVPERVIDVHLHGVPHDAQLGSPPYWGPALFGQDRAVPRTGKDHHEATLEAMRRNNIVLGFVSQDRSGDDFDHARDWAREANPKILPTMTQRPILDGKSPDELARLFDDGSFHAFAEFSLQYDGLKLDDEMFEPFIGMAEARGIPIGLHTGSGPPEQVYRSNPKFRLGLGRPLHVEEVLVRHPDLKLWLMHAGWPWEEEMAALMTQYPKVYMDVSPMIWMMDQTSFDQMLQKYIGLGLGRRILFGTDQMDWPQAIDDAVAKIENSTVLTREQKDDIFFNNAVRFFGLDEKTLEM